MVIGLLGGSFDPPHQGHVHITRAALVRFRLDRVWWLVSPGNPLKTHGPAPMSLRIKAAQAIMRHPRVVVTDLEARLGTRFTAQTLSELRRRYPGVRFVWLMGSDNMAQLHRWQNWQNIIETHNIGVIARPGARIAANMSRAAQMYRGARLSGRASEILARRDPPAWCFVNLPLSSESSSRIRAAGKWNAGHEVSKT